MIYYAQISRAATPRSWEASDGSLRNFTGKTRRMALPHKAVSPPLMYLSGLSQAPHLMHRRRFRFPPPPMSERSESFEGDVEGKKRKTLR